MIRVENNVRSSVIFRAFYSNVRAIKISIGHVDRSIIFNR